MKTTTQAVAGSLRAAGFKADRFNGGGFSVFRVIGRNAIGVEHWMLNGETETDRAAKLSRYETTLRAAGFAVRSPEHAGMALTIAL